MALNWLGKQVDAKVRRAQVLGVNFTMGASVQHAKTNHDWQNRTATLEGSIDVVEYAHETAEGVEGAWGSRDVAYALIHEMGGIIKPVRAKLLSFEIDGERVFAKEVKIPARPYLRPAADETYPHLAENIAHFYNKGGTA